MREMKDSGIEWIGEIPAKWTRKKLNYLSERIGDVTTCMAQSEQAGHWPLRSSPQAALVGGLLSLGSAFRTQQVCGTKSLVAQPGRRLIWSKNVFNGIFLVLEYFHQKYIRSGRCKMFI